MDTLISIFKRRSPSHRRGGAGQSGAGGGGGEERVEQPAECWLLRLMPPELLHAILHALLAAGESDGQPLRDVAAWCLTCAAFNDVCDDETRCRLRCLGAYPGLFGLALSPLYGAPQSRALSSLSSSSSSTSPTSSSPSSPSPSSSSSHTLEASASASSVSHRRGGRRPPRLTWRQRVELMSHLPQRISLCAGNREREVARSATQGVGSALLKRIFKREDSDDVVFAVDIKSGRQHANANGSVNNLIADHPFPSTNEALLAKLFDDYDYVDADGALDATAESIDTSARAGGGRDAAASTTTTTAATAAAGEAAEQRAERKAMFVGSLLFRGVEYFEMTVVYNHVSWNRAVAIAVAQYFEQMNFLGWTADAIAYHSDDGTIRGGVENEVYRLRVFSSGAVVGCGVDWDAGDLFFVYNGTPTEPAEVHIHKPLLLRAPWYPAVASMSRDDVLRVNFGHEPFAFDLRTFVLKKRANDLASLHDVLVVHHANLL